MPRRQSRQIPELFRDYLDVVRQEGAPYPDRPDDAAGIQIFAILAIVISFAK
jgi:hypothetical protein